MAVRYYTDDCRYRLPQKRLTAQWLRGVAAAEGYTLGDVSYIFCSAQRLLEMNRQYLGHDYFTDVITFDYSDRRGTHVVSGDIFIDVETVRDNARLYGARPLDEMRRVVVHGVLHLCGQGDKTPRTNAQMHRKEDRYLRFWEACGRPGQSRKGLPPDPPKRLKRPEKGQSRTADPGGGQRGTARGRPNCRRTNGTARTTRRAGHHSQETDHMKLEYDIVVIGGGHAGCEAASAAARLGSRTLLLTMDMTKMASMSCNPAIGGVAKGQIVREIDALGGQTGRITDLTAVQFRMLNRSKGAAMWSPRAQCDKTRFSECWRRTLEQTANLSIWQDAATELLFGETNGGRPRVCGVRTRMGVEFACRAVVLTAGTFLDGVMHCGEAHAEGGRAGDAASHGITESLRRMGFESGRMKTGTPARLDARSIDFSLLEPQYGDENPSKFSFSSETQPVENQLPCYLVYTTPEVHAVLRGGFDRSPLFNGTIHGIGPRYCPSIEDKLRTFADKEQHQLFLEPEGRTTNEYYLNGFSSSLPWEVQWEALHRIRGFEHLEIYRPGYAIEYDYFPPTQLHHSLETKAVRGLFFAGQVNGTTGYEEAAAQGLMAGINAHRQLRGEEPIVLRRDEAYIGVLIDDLVTKGVDEPYRMFTSRAEYRILLRQDNADLRLTPKGYEIGLITAERYAEFEQKKSRVESLVAFAHGLSVKAAEINDYLKTVGSDPLTQGRKLHDILMRNQVDFASLRGVLPKLRRFLDDNPMSGEEIEEAEIRIKYRGYIEREKFIAEKLHRLENIRIPDDFDFHSMQALTIEARQKLSRIRPTTIGQASRIPGVSPADVNVLLVKFGR